MTRPILRQDFTVDKDGFQTGVSDIAVGRFAGFRDELPAGAPFLTYDTTDGDLAMVVGGKKIYLLPPPDYKINRTHTWTGTSASLDYQRGGAQTMAMHATLLAPAALLTFTENQFALRLQSGLQAEHVAYATKAGIKIKSTTEHYDGYGLIYDRAQFGDMTEPWMLVWWQNCEQPIVLILEKHPERMYCLATGGIIKAEYKKNAGNVAVMPLWGIRKYHNKECAAWVDKGVPADAVEEMRLWTRRLQDFPVGSTERFKLDRAKGTVQIRDTFEYISNQSDWPVQRETMAPVSAIVAHAFKHGYSDSFQGKIVETNTMTGFGPFPYVPGKSYTYTIPYARCIDHQVAPVRVENDSRYDAYVEEINRYIPDPKFTYGGDYDYDKDSPLDALHDLRMLAWATWSLDENRRVARFKDLQKAILKITPDNYHHEIEPYTGVEYWWDKQLFDQDGIVQFDYEWYNGLNMAAPYAYWQFGQGITTKDDLKKFYPYIQNWGRYMDLRHDWTNLAPPVTIPGSMINIDGNMHATSGVISYARVAHLMGDEPMADRMAYLASKMFITWYDIWLAPEWAQEQEAWGLSDKHVDPRSQAALMLLHANGIGNGGVGFWCNTYGDCEPELLDFYRASFYDKLKDFEYGKWEEWAAKDSPSWANKPVKHGNERYVQWGRNAERAVHHYNKDPHFIARALVFHEPLEQTQKYAIEHSGEVLEAFIAGQHPMVMFPAGARFGGNVWDEKTHTLTTTLLRETDPTVTVLIESKTAPLAVKGCKSWKYVPEHDAGRAYIEVDFAGQDKIVLESQY